MLLHRWQTCLMQWFTVYQWTSASGMSAWIADTSTAILVVEWYDRYRSYHQYYPYRRMVDIGSISGYHLVRWYPSIGWYPLIRGYQLILHIDHSVDMKYYRVEIHDAQHRVSHLVTCRWQMSANVMSSTTLLMYAMRTSLHLGCVHPRMYTRDVGQ